jgi:hypothetical protein
MVAHFDCNGDTGRSYYFQKHSDPASFKRWAVSHKGATAMIVDTDIRERLSLYCAITKLTQEKAANVALREMLQRAEQDPMVKAKMDRVAALKAELASI